MIYPLPESRSRSAFAKINLGLHVLERRVDGFHDIETVMVAIEWHDRISVAPSENLRFSSSDPQLQNDDNLCLRAARLIQGEVGRTDGAVIHLEKHLPYGAGLGGGSSDAASTLLLLDELWDLTLSQDRLSALAATLGSDVPFFISGTPSLAEGRGELLTKLPSYVLPFHIVVALPNERVSTAEAYALVRPDNRERPQLSALVQSNDLQAWRTHLMNDFEHPIMERHPAIQAVRDAMYDAGAGYAAMSGSGSAVFGLFTDASPAHAAAEAFREQGLVTWHGRSVK